jgi:ketosteroid isomerase-like protein
MSVGARLERAYADMAAADLDKLMGLYMEDAIIQSAGAPALVGFAAIRSFWSTVFERYRVELAPRVGEETVFGDAVVVRGSAAGRMVPRNGEPAMDVDVWFMQVYRDGGDGLWRFWRGANGPNSAE